MQNWKNKTGSDINEIEKREAAKETWKQNVILWRLNTEKILDRVVSNKKAHTKFSILSVQEEPSLHILQTRSREWGCYKQVL